MKNLSQLILFFLFVLVCSSFGTAIISHAGDIYTTNQYYNTTGGWNITDSQYLSNVSGVLDVNETELNATIDARATGVSDGVGFNVTDTSLNATGQIVGVNTSYIQIRVGETCPAGSSIRVIYENGTVVCETDSTSDADADPTNELQSYSDFPLFNTTHLSNFTNDEGYITNITMNKTILWSNILNKFITAVDDDWIYMSGTTATFNESKLTTTYYNINQTNMIAGTLDGGNITNTQHLDGNYDSITMNFSESAGSPGIDIRINFTNITGFNRGIMRYNTGSISGDYPIIQMWDYVDGAWEDYPPVGESLNFATITQPVFDDSTHLSGGIAQMRIYKSSNGNTNNHYYIDWIAIAKGYGTPAGQETDPYSIHRDGSVSLSGDWNQGAFNFTNTDSWFLGKLNWSAIQNTPNLAELTDWAGAVTLSDTGAMIIPALAQFYNATPVTHDLYSLGNSTHWWKEIYATTIYSTNIYTDTINASTMNSTDINSEDINSDTLDLQDNMTIGGHQIKKDGNDLVVVIT